MYIKKKYLNKRKKFLKLYGKHNDHLESNYKQCHLVL